MEPDTNKLLTAPRKFLLGASLLGRGLGIILSSPKLLVLGLIPAVISGALYITGLVFLIDFIADLSRTVTWFADGWAEAWRDLIQVFAGISIVGITALLGILTFTAVTLLIGDPFYERISELVEDRYGGVPGKVEVGFWRSLGRGLIESIRLIALSVLIGIPLFFAGFLPVVGQTVVPVIGATVGGWLLVVELTSVPFQRRGQRLRQRREVLKRHRAQSLGFGVAVFCSFLIPLGAILLMPAAIAGATLLSRQLSGHPITPAREPLTRSAG